MKARNEREIPVLFIRGSSELGRATGFTDKRIHARWRDAGLRYSVSEGGVFLYDPKDVTSFIKRFYAPQEVKESLKS